MPAESNVLQSVGSYCVASCSEFTYGLRSLLGHPGNYEKDCGDLSLCESVQHPRQNFVEAAQAVSTVIALDVNGDGDTLP